MTHKKNNVAFNKLMRRRIALLLWHMVSSIHYLRIPAKQISADNYVSYNVRYFLRPISVYTNQQTGHLEGMYEVAINLEKELKLWKDWGSQFKDDLQKDREALNEVRKNNRKNSVVL